MNEQGEFSNRLTSRISSSERPSLIASFLMSFKMQLTDNQVAPEMTPRQRAESQGD